MRVMLAVIAVLAVSESLPAADETDGFTSLFDGKSLAGWVNKTEDGQPNADNKWTVKDGVLTATPGTGWLGTKEMYGDFVLKLEWRVPENGNSGVFIRVPDLKPGQHPHIDAIEIQVLDDNGPQYKGKLEPYQFAGSIYGAVPAKDAGYKGAGEWNRFEITCRGEKISVVMNGKPAAEADVTQVETLSRRPRRGYIGLQNHGSGVEYRNIELKVLK